MNLVENLMFEVIKIATMRHSILCFFLGVICTTISTSLNAQGIEKQEYIVEAHLVESVLNKRICDKLKIDDSQVHIKKIFGDHVYKISFAPSEISKQININDIAAVKGIHACNINVKTELRRTPNDPDFRGQVDMSLIQAEQAWDFSTGGSTVSGKQIVIAIMDDGFDFEHEDLVPNLWNNVGEIPNNGIDDDGNDYIDDFIGLNVNSGNDALDVRSHGTGVVGILGARGNNGIGISGVAWDAQLMLISGISSAGDIIEANNYILNMRQRFNETNGAEGAFIVASNYSGGIPNAFAEDNPILCQTYEALGAEGVLSLSAGPNREQDIDVIGDLPADCSSNHLIIVTNTDTEMDELVMNAAIGPRLVDLGAPGEGTLSTRPDNNYDNFGGTSAATPHVSGTIALIYGAACADFENLADTNPSQAALDVKDLIMSNVDQKSSLTGVTVSGGRLNSFAAVRGLREFCGVEAEIMSITFENPVDNTQGSIEVIVETPFTGDHELLIHDTQGRLMMVRAIPPTLFGQSRLFLDNLSLNTGLYFMTILNDQDRQTNKFFVLD